MCGERSPVCVFYGTGPNFASGKTTAGTGRGISSLWEAQAKTGCVSGAPLPASALTPTSASVEASPSVIGAFFGPLNLAPS